LYDLAYANGEESPVYRALPSSGFPSFPGG
jgi:hypothetical protein